MSDSGSVGNNDATRVKGVTVVKPIVYGSVSQPFGKKREPDGHTHEWTIYVKPFSNEDMSAYVKKVQFRLHDSYANCNRIVSKPPYEVSETGWGEFEVQIKIHFHDAAAEKAVTVYHVLKLFHASSGESSASTSTTSSALVQGRKTVVSEFYDEIVFQDPTQYMHTLLTTTRPLTLSAYKHTTDFEERRNKNLAAVTEARKKVQTEISDLKEKVKIAKETIAKFKSEIIKCQNERDFSTASPLL